MKALSYLRFEGCPLSAAELQHLGRSESIRYLDLNGCPITDAAVGHLPLERLTNLLLHDTPITNASLVHFSRLRDGAILHLSSTKLTDAGLDQIEVLARRLVIFVGDSDLSPEAQRKIVRIQDECNINPWRPDRAADQAEDRARDPDADVQ